MMDTSLSRRIVGCTGLLKPNRLGRCLTVRDRGFPPREHLASRRLGLTYLYDFAKCPAVVEVVLLAPHDEGRCFIHNVTLMFAVRDL